MTLTSVVETVPPVVEAPIASLRNVVKTDADAVILDGVSFDIYPGTITLITGPSGSGKSTCLRALGGITAVNSGIVEVFGQQIQNMTETQKDDVLVNRLGFAHQRPNLDPDRTVEENMVRIAEATNAPGDLARRAAKLAIAYGFGQHMKRPVRTLSGGEQGRVSVARAFETKPDMVFLDEPTDSIDPKGTAEVFRLLGMFRNAGVTIVMVTHDADMAREIADTEIVIKSGQVDNVIDRQSINNLL